MLAKNLKSNRWRVFGAIIWQELGDLKAFVEYIALQRSTIYTLSFTEFHYHLCRYPVSFPIMSERELTLCVAHLREARFQIVFNLFHCKYAGSISIPSSLFTPRWTSSE